MCSHIAHWGTPNLVPTGEGFLVSMGVFAVSVFFCLSGFIMVNNHADDFGKPSLLAPYAVKRIFRIYPAYLFYSLAAVFLVGLFHFSTWDQSLSKINSPLEILSAILLFPLSPNAHAFVMVGWSLFHEVLFYTAFAFLIVSLRLGIIACLIFFGLSFGNILSNFPHLPYLTEINALFLIGMGISFLNEKISLPKFVCWASIILGLGLFIYGAMKGTAAFQFGRIIASAFLLGGTVFLDSKLPLKKESRGYLGSFFNWLGNISFSLYLGHTCAQMIAFRFFGPPTGITIAAFIIFPLLIASATYLVIEKPSQRIGRDLLHRLKNSTKSPA